MNVFNKESSDSRISRELFFKLLNTVEVDQIETESTERTELVVTRRIIGGTTSSNGSSPEVTLSEKNLGLVVWDTLDGVSPSTSEFDSRLTGFASRIHQQNLLIAEGFGEELFGFTKIAVVESSGSESDLGSLFDESLEDLRMAVTLVDGGVGR